MNKLIIIIIVLLFISCSKEELPKQVYFLNSETGSDNNNGKSPETAWKNFSSINKIELKPGAKILLASGSVFQGGLVLEDVSGTTDAPVEISMYKSSENANLPLIDAKGFANGITLLNCNNVVVSDLEITGNGRGVVQAGNKGQSMHCGVLVTTTTEGIYENIQLRNLKIRDVFFEDAGYKRDKNEVRTANGTQSYGWGIRI
ncbi:MAG: hypothetical protein ACK5HT_23125, partial [Draconibacterium sp.]